MATALLIIDVQQALYPGKDDYFEINRVIESISHLITRARIAKVPVVFIQLEEEGSPLAYSNDGWKLANSLDTEPTDLYVRKTTPDSFYQTKLEKLLPREDFERLIICGLQTEYRVNETVRQALKLGYDVELAADAHSTIDNPTAEEIIAEHNEELAHLTGPVARIDVKPAAAIRI